MARPFTILHLSDVHIGSPSSKFEEDQVLKDLEIDLKKFADKSFRPDLLVFNGDLVFGQRPGYSIARQYDRADGWLRSIYHTLNVSPSKVPLAIVPGNHDRNLEEITRDSIDWIRSDQRTVSELREHMEHDTRQWQRFIFPQQEWAQFASKWGYSRLAFDESLHMATFVVNWGDERIGIAALNSAWACYKDGDAEKGKLWIGELQIQKALRELDNCTFRIAITHHPIPWLRSEEEEWFKQRIQTQFQVHLHGHDHSAWIEDQARHLKVAAGACYQEAKKPKAYSWISIDFPQRSAKVHLRRYEERGSGGWCPFSLPNVTDEMGVANVSALFLSRPEESRTNDKPIDGERSVRRVSSRTQKLDFDQISDFTTFIDILESSFGFRWEPWRRRESDSKVIVYWPVRLRRPTPIHAVQCFAAAGLQRLGAKVVLCLDDFGNPEGRQASFNKSASRWLGVVKSSPRKVERLLFSQIIRPKSPNGAWSKVQTWLGTTDYRLDRVFKISKLEATDLDELSKRRPRRLLTPPLVWTALEYLSKRYSGYKVLTLGGHDESELWQAWRDLAALSTSHVGHIYVPALKEAISDQNRTLHMARTGLNLIWHSKQDIKRAIEQDLGKGGDSFSEGRLVGWCFSGCIRLPAFIAGANLALKVGEKKIESVNDLDGTDAREIGTAMSEWAAKWLLP